MELKRLRVEQFAGIRDIDLEFNRGLNLIFGKNESGKSSIIELIYNLFFKPIKLNKRTEKQFIEKYFPNYEDGSLDTIGGSISFIQDGLSYRLDKKWSLNATGREELYIDGRGKIENQEKISEILKECLVYGEGFYREVVFASKKRASLAVESIMKLDKKNEDLLSAMSKTVYETGGVSIEKIEKEIDSRIERLESNWDFDNNWPKNGKIKRGLENRWKQGVGLILSSYYELEEIKKSEKEYIKSEEKKTECKAEIRKLEEKKTALEERKKELEKNEENIKRCSELEETLKILSGERKALVSLVEDIPRLAENIQELSKLSIEYNESKKYNRYKKLIDLKKDLDRAYGRLSRATAIDKDDVERLKENNLINETLKAKLRGVNIAIKLNEDSGEKVEIKSLISGEIVELKGEIKIKEAVEIKVGGSRLSISPSSIDIETIKNDMEKLEREKDSLLQKYKIYDLEKLEEGYKEYDLLKEEYEEAEYLYKKELGEDDFELLEKSMGGIRKFRELEEVEGNIYRLTKGRTLEVELEINKEKYSNFLKEYESLENIENKIKNLDFEIKQREKKLAELRATVPEKFNKVGDKYEEELGLEIDKISKNIKYLEEECLRLEVEIGGLGRYSLEEYMEEINKKEEEFKAYKEECLRLKEIRKKFLETKNELDINQIAEIGKNFEKKLNFISDGGLRVSNLTPDLQTRLKSQRRNLRFETLSDGSKDTISIAFKLAFLEYLYKDNAGIIIIDDPLTEMDRGRLEFSCEILRKFAEKNQVIFTTCDEKYIELLKTDGNNSFKLLKM